MICNLNKIIFSLSSLIWAFSLGVQKMSEFGMFSKECFACKVKDCNHCAKCVKHLHNFSNDNNQSRHCFDIYQPNCSNTYYNWNRHHFRPTMLEQRCPYNKIIIHLSIIFLLHFPIIIITINFEMRLILKSDVEKQTYLLY